MTFNYAVDSARMMRAMDTEDDIGAVIRLHFEIDRALEHVVGAIIPNPEQLSHRYMDQRIRFLGALGLPEVRIAPARIMNEIRNRFAHKEKETLVDLDIIQLQKAVEALLGNVIPSHFALINNKKGSQREWRFGEMNLKQKFCLLGYMTLAGIATIENDFPKVNLNASRSTPIA